MTRAATKAKAAIVKVKQAMAPTVDASEGGEVGPSITQESISIPEKVHLLGMERCLRILEDYIPPKIKEEAQRRSMGKGL